ncbi:hypothetical protein JCM3770_002092 [Rhodotorula araucariae]
MATLLAHDYASLAKEAGRRHSDVRDAADKALQLIKAGKDDVFDDLRADPPPAEHPLYQPIFLASATRNAKVIALAVSALQRLILSAAVPRAFVAQILDTLEQVIPQGVDIQLKVLQTLVSLLTTTAPRPGAHPGAPVEKLVQGEELGRALELSHRLSTSKIPVVASTASATLRQLFMFVFERVGEEDALVAASDDAASDPTLPRAMFDVDVPPLEEDRAAALGATLALQPRFIEGDTPASPVPSAPPALPMRAEPDANQAKSIRLRPAARDAYLLLEDLCLLIAGSVEGGPDGEPSFLRWGSLSRTFGLELVESIISGFGDIVRAHPELLLVLRAHLCPLLIRFLSSPPHSTLSSSTSFAFSFPLTLRLTRVVFLLLKQFSDLLTLESEVFLTMFVRVIAPGDRGEGEGGHPTGATGQHSPLWMRVLALEIFRGLCADFPLMIKFFRRYDAAAAEDCERRGDKGNKGKAKAAGATRGSTVFSDMLTAFNRLATEKPAALGVGAAVIYGSSLGPVFSHGHGYVGAASPPASSGSGVIDSAMEMGWGVAAGVGSVVGSSVAAAAGAVSSAHQAPPPSLSSATAAMKLQCIDQLDKAEPPHIPESYIFLLALQCLAALTDGFGAFTLAASADIAQRYSLAGPAVDWAALEARDEAQADAQVTTLRVVRAMAETTWPAFLASLSFFIATALSDDLFADVVASLENFTIVLGVLDLETPREAFLTSLCKFAMPAQVVSHLATQDHHPALQAAKPSSAAAAAATAVLSAGAESLALLAGAAAGTAGALPVGLSARNLACLRALITVAHFLAGALGYSWFCVFETLQNADFVLRATSAARGTKKRNPAPPAPAAAAAASAAGPAASAPTAPGAAPGEAPPLPVLPSEADEVAAQRAIGELFDVSQALDDGAFRKFAGALCRLSGEMIGLAMHEDGSVVVLAGGTDEASLNGATTPTRTSLDTPSRRRSSGIRAGARTDTSFGVAKLGAVALLNIARLIERPPAVGWDLATGHLLHVLHCVTAPTAVRMQAADVLGQLLTLAPKSLASLVDRAGDGDGHDVAQRVQAQVLSALAAQAEPAPRLQSAVDVDIRRRALETLLRILESNGHALVTGWGTIFHVLRTACPTPSSTAGAWPVPPSPIPSSARRSLDTISEYDGMGPMTPLRTGGVGDGGGGYFSARDAGAARGAKTGVLVRTSFPSLQLICTDFLDPLSAGEIRDCIGTLAEFGKQGEDVNVALTAGGLLWNVSDHVQAKGRTDDAATTHDGLWMYLLQNLLALCRDARQEVRDAAISNVFRSISMYGSTLDSATWDAVCWEVVFPLVEDISASIEQQNMRGPDDDDALGEETVPQANGPPIRLVDKQWDDSKQLALRSVGDVFFEYLAQLVKTDRYEEIWRAFVSQVQRTFVRDRPHPATAAMQALEKVLTVSLNMADADRIAFSWEVAWTVWDEIGSAVQENALSAAGCGGDKVFTQVNLETFVRVVVPIYTPPYISFDLARVERLLSVLKAVLTYSKSPDYRSDVDGLMPLQSAILEVIAVIKLDEIPGATSAVLSDLAEYLMLAFKPPVAKPRAPAATRTAGVQQITYIALAKEIMPHVQWLYRKYVDDPLVYEQHAVSKMLQAYALPLRLKHDCPAPAKFGSAEPLWKTATINYLKAVRDVTAGLQQLDEQLSPEMHEDIWTQVVAGFEGALLAANSTATRSLEDLKQEENFDLALLISLERDVIPHLGSPRVPDALIRRLGKTLQFASRLYDLDLPSSSRLHVKGSAIDTPPPTPPEPRFDPDFDKQVLGEMHGTTVEVVETARERFAYWCLDLLFHVCAADEQASLPRQRIAALIVPSLLNRCTAVFRTYVADAPLRGKMPFPRVRQEELVYLLQQLLSLRLFPNSLWAALQPFPSEAVASPEPPDAGLPLAALVRSALLRSPRAHLYELHPCFTDLLQLSSLAPSITAAYIPHRRLGILDAEAGVATYEGLPAGFDPAIVGRARRPDEKVETDVAKLVLACLETVGQEIGAGRS